MVLTVSKDQELVMKRLGKKSKCTKAHPTHLSKQEKVKGLAAQKWCGMM